MRKFFRYLKTGFGLLFIIVAWALGIVFVSYSQTAILVYSLFCYVLCHYIKGGVDPFMSFYYPFYRCLTYVMFAVPWVTYLLILNCVWLLTGEE